METHWLLQTHGDPIGAIQEFLYETWKTAGLGGLVFPLDDSAPQLVEDPAQVYWFNPFKPLMLDNTARLIPDLVRDNPALSFGAVMRPCEMRAFNEVLKRQTPDLKRAILTICVDCLGTFDEADYRWHVERKGSLQKLTHDTMNFARTGGILSYRYRSACQICAAQESGAADINICVFGMPARQHILLQVRKDLPIDLEPVLNEMATTQGAAEAILKRDRLLVRMGDRQYLARDRIVLGLAESLPMDLDELLEKLDSCWTCQECMLACPICSSDFPQIEIDGKYQRKDILSWITSCSGCGMCEQACPRQLPLTAIFSRVRFELARSLSLAGT